MKNFFAYLLFAAIISISNNTHAGVRSAAEPVDTKPVNFSTLQKDTEKLYKEIPDINDKKAIQKYLQNRIKITATANINENEVSNPSSTSIVNTEELKKMGAKIRVEGKTACIEGVETLTGSQVTATDLRAGAALIIAGICAEGETEIYGIEHVERGYEEIANRFNSLGAKIERVSE